MDLPKITLAIRAAAAAAGLAALTTGLQPPVHDVESERAKLIARQESRVEAARASLNARPLLGSSHLPPFNATAAIAREEFLLRRLASTPGEMH